MDLITILQLISFIIIIVLFGYYFVRVYRGKHPETMICWQCRICMQKCPLRVEPTHFMIAARINDPNYPVRVGSERLPAKDVALMCGTCKGLCQIVCPQKLPIRSVIEDLQHDASV